MIASNPCGPGVYPPMQHSLESLRGEQEVELKGLLQTE